MDHPTTIELAGDIEVMILTRIPKKESVCDLSDTLHIILNFGIPLIQSPVIHGKVQSICQIDYLNES